MGVAVDGVESARSMPTGAGGELRALDDRDIRPAAQGEVVQQARPDDAATDDHHAVRGSHCRIPITCDEMPDTVVTLLTHESVTTRY